MGSHLYKSLFLLHAEVVLRLFAYDYVSALPQEGHRAVLARSRDHLVCLAYLGGTWFFRHTPTVRGLNRRRFMEG